MSGSARFLAVLLKCGGLATMRNEKHKFYGEGEASVFLTWCVFTRLFMEYTVSMEGFGSRTMA